MKNETKNLLISLTAIFAIIALFISVIIFIVKFPNRTKIIQVKAVGKSSLIYPEEYYLIDKNEHSMQISFEDFKEIMEGFEKGYLVYISYEDDVWDEAITIGYEDKIYDIEVFYRESDK